MSNNFSNKELIMEKIQNQDIEYQKENSNNQLWQNKLFEDQIIKKLTAIEYVIDKSVSSHKDKGLTLNKNNKRVN